MIDRELKAGRSEEGSQPAFTKLGEPGKYELFDDVNSKRS